MTALPSAIRTVKWMVRDTFRQSLATKLFWVMLGITVLATVFCAGVRLRQDDAPREKHPDELKVRHPAGLPDSEKARQEGIDRGTGELSFGFGLMRVPVSRTQADARFVQLWMAGILADSVGVLLALLWTAGFLPTFLEPQHVTVLLAKPAPRWALVAGKYLGVVLFVALQAGLFVGGTWLGLGVATGVWDATYWLAVPLLVVSFAVFYAFSAFLAVCTRSTVVSVFGTLLFWLLCWAMNFTHHKLVHDEMQARDTGAAPAVSPGGRALVSAGYWVLPKPFDLTGMFFDAMRAQDLSMKAEELTAAERAGAYHPELSVLASLLFAVAVLGVAGHEFRKMDY